MNAILKTAYIHEIKGQCQHAVNAFNMIAYSIRGYNTEENSVRRTYYFDEVFRNIHSFLNHAANVSKLFKPSEETKTDANNIKTTFLPVEKADRKAFLAAEYNVSDDHAIHGRALRNDLEHYDERLDKWGKKNHGHLYHEVIHDPSSKRATMNLSDIDMTTVMRWFNPGNNKFTFIGKEYDLNTLLNAVNEIGVLSASLLQKEWRNDEGDSLTMNFFQGR